MDRQNRCAMHPWIWRGVVSTTIRVRLAGSSGSLVRQTDGVASAQWFSVAHLLENAKVCAT